MIRIVIERFVKIYFFATFFILSSPSSSVNSVPPCFSFVGNGYAV